MAEWNDYDFQNIVSEPVDYSVLIGQPLSGKTFISNALVKHLGFKLVDMKAVEEVVKKSLGTEDEPFEGQVPIDKVEAEIIKNF